MTPEEKLCSRSWRLRNSLWVLTCILGFGMLNWAAYLYIGLKSKRRSWLIWAGVWGAWFVMGMFIPTAKKGDDPTTLESISGGVLAIGFLAGIVQALIINREWLKWRAANGSTAWYSGDTPATSGQQIPGVTGAQDMDRALQGTVAPAPPPPPPPSATTSYPPPASPAAPVDINSAGAAELQARLGLPQEVAERIVADRAKTGGFSSPEQLLSSGAIPPHLFAQVSNHIVVGQSAKDPSAAPHPPHGGGRRLDL